MKNILIYQNSKNPIHKLDESVSSSYSNVSESKYCMGGIFTEFDVINENQRIYTAEEFVPHLNELMEKKEKLGVIYGEFDHPAEFDSSLTRASHVIEHLEYVKEKKQVTGKIRLISTFFGKEAKALVDDGLPVFVSSRAAGITESNGKVKIKKLFTYDLVADPGFSSAKMKCLNESVGLSMDSNIRIFDLSSDSQTNEMFNMNKDDMVTKNQLNTYSKYLNKELERLENIITNKAMTHNENVEENKDLMNYHGDLHEKIERIAEYLEYLSEKVQIVVTDQVSLKDTTKKLEEKTVQDNVIIEKLVEHNEYLASKIEQTIEFSNYLAENMNGVVEYGNYLAEQIDSVIDHNNYLAEKIDQTIVFSDYIAENLDKSIEFSNYLSENLDNSIEFSNYLSENLEKSIGFSDYLCENIENNISYSKYLSEQLEKGIRYSEYLGEKIEKTIHFADYLAENVEHSIEYSTYLAENLDKNILYSEYIAEQLDSNIQYSEYLAENVDTTIKYSEYLAENISTTIDFADYLSENLGNSIEYTESIVDHVNETKGIKKIKKLSKFNESYNLDEEADIAALEPATFDEFQDSMIQDDDTAASFDSDKGVGFDEIQPIEFTDKEGTGVEFGKDGEFVTGGKDGEFEIENEDDDQFVANQHIIVKGTGKTGKILEVDGDEIKVQLDGEDVVQSFMSSDLVKQGSEDDTEPDIVEMVNSRIIEARKRRASTQAEPHFLRYLSSDNKSKFNALSEQQKSTVIRALNESDGYFGESDIIRIWNYALNK